MAAVTGIALVKRIPYRGDALEEFSNTYHFKTLPPGDDSSWGVLVTDLWNIEKTIYTPGILLVAAYGYDSDDPTAHHVFAHDYTVPGPPPAGTLASPGDGSAGDQAAMIGWKMNRLSSKGKPVYCRKYQHGARIATGGGDNLDPTYKAALNSYAQLVQNFHGGLRTQRVDDVATAIVLHDYVTTRTLKRRGKRPR